MPVRLLRQKLAHPHHGYFAPCQHNLAAAAVVDADRIGELGVMVPETEIEIPARIVRHLDGVGEGAVECQGIFAV